MADNPYAKYANPYAGYVPVGVPDPTKPLDLKSKQLGIQKDESALALTPYERRKQAAEAESAEIKAKTDQETYAAAHPQVGTSGAYGNDFLKTLPNADQQIVKGLAEGRLAFPGSFALRSPYWQTKLQQVAQYDPTFDATNYNARAAARKNAISGKLGTSNNALNTAIGHLAQLQGQIGGTYSTGGYPFATTVNSIANSLSKGAGSPGVTNFQDTAQKLADELESVYRNGGGAEQGVVRQLRSLDVNASEAQKQGVIKNAMDLLASKMAANLSQYNFGTGGKPAWQMLDPAAQHAIQQVDPSIADKYFAVPAGFGGGHGDGAPPIGGGGGTPPSGPTHPDYSGMVGGPSAGLATGGVRNVYDPVMANTLSTFIKKGAPYETAAAFTQSHGFTPPNPQDYAAAVEFAKAHNGATNVRANRQVATTMGERLAASPLAAGVAAAGSAGTAGLLDSVGRNLVGPQWDANRAALAMTNPTSDLLGNVAGGAAGMFGAGGLAGNALRAGVKGGVGRDLLAFGLKNPALTGAAGDTAYGAAYGANENPNDPLAGAGVGAIAGLGGGLAGAGLAKAGGAALQGVTDPAIQRLRAEGIPLTVGEVLGGGAKKAQDALTSIFGPGNMVARRYNDGRLALNQAAFNQGGQVIGAPINAVGQAGIDALNTAKNKAYSDALNPVSLNLDVPSFTEPMAGIIGQADKIPAGELPEGFAGVNLRHFIGNNAIDGTMNGEGFQNAYRGLARTASRAAPKVEGHDVGQVIGQAKNLLASTLEDQNPGAYQGFLQANTANRNLNVLANAVNAAKNQIGDNGEPLFTPAQLGTAATANGRQFGGNIAAAAGNRPFNQLAMDAQRVMSSKLPDSGTATRALVTGGLLTGGGMFGGHENGLEGAGEGALTPLAILSLLGTRRGQSLLTGALLNRTAADQLTGRYLARSPQIGGSILTAAGIPLLTGPQAQ